MYQFASLLRLNKPIGIFLLFWPCAWSLAMTQWYVVNNYLFIKYLILFFIGSIIMRSAGCVYNDIVDKKIDIELLIKNIHNNQIIKDDNIYILLP